LHVHIQSIAKNCVPLDKEVESEVSDCRVAYC
jgi:hypothetical protein